MLSIWNIDLSIFLVVVTLHWSCDILEDPPLPIDFHIVFVGFNAGFATIETGWHLKPLGYLFPQEHAIDHVHFKQFDDFRTCEQCSELHIVFRLPNVSVILILHSGNPIGNWSWFAMFIYFHQPLSMSWNEVTRVLNNAICCQKMYLDQLPILDHIGWSKPFTRNNQGQ